MIREMDRAYLKRPDRGVPLPRSGRPLAVLIVTYKSHDLLEKCLGSIAEHLPELQVYVYENSGEGYPGREELTRRYPGAHWVLGPVNLGFAAAVNALVEHTPPDTDLLVLNPDCRLRGPLTRTRELLRQPVVAAVSPMLRDYAAPGPARWDIATRRATLIRSLVAVAGYSDSLRGTRFSNLYARQPTESQSIDGYVGGACLAISRAAWNAVGGFDEEFYLYAEEADWQARARAAGWRVLLADELGADHGNFVTAEGANGLNSAHGGDYSTAERRRIHDLLRANIALFLEHQDTVHHADIYLAGTTLLDRLQRSKRAARREARAKQRTGLPAIVITTNRLVVDCISISGTAGSVGGSGSRSISTVTLPAAISRRATTVGLSFSQATVGSAPFARRRARCAASRTSWNRLSTFVRQSSTVIRAMALNL